MQCASDNYNKISKFEDEKLIVHSIAKKNVIHIPMRTFRLGSA